MRFYSNQVQNISPVHKHGLGFFVIVYVYRNHIYPGFLHLVNNTSEQYVMSRGDALI